MVTILNSETALALATDLPSIPSEEEIVDIFMIKILVHLAKQMMKVTLPLQRNMKFASMNHVL